MADQYSSPAPATDAQPAMREQIAFARLPQRELRIKVWEGKEEEASGVEDLPTALMPATLAGEKQEQPASPEVPSDQPASNGAQEGEGERGDADLPTRPMVAQLAVPERVHAQRSLERRFPEQSYRQAIPPRPLPGQTREQQQQGLPAQAAANLNLNQSPTRQQPMRPGMPLSLPSYPQPVAAPAPARPERRKSKMRVVVVLNMILLLVAGGLIYWIVAFQPFSVPDVTRPSLSFSNANLGIALQYPQGWTSQLDGLHQSVSFFDANHIDHVSISVTPSNGTSMTSFVNKEVAQLGLTAQKNLSPVTFAGTNWQQVQGNVLVSGATYTERLLVALHGNRFYAIVFYAIIQQNATPGPVVTYADADRLFFSMFRASFQFL